MLRKRKAEFHELVWRAAAIEGDNAPRIADRIIGEAFPATARAAETEGADRMLRDGVIREVKRVLRGAGPDERQRDFHEIDPEFAPLVAPLRTHAYYVPSTEQYVEVPRLIADPDLLDEARRFMRMKGLECIAEADGLDSLYAAVTGEG